MMAPAAKWIGSTYTTYSAVQTSDALYAFCSKHPACKTQLAMARLRSPAFAFEEPAIGRMDSGNSAALS